VFICDTAALTETAKLPRRARFYDTLIKRLYLTC
jgi:hypothetical protein